MPVFRAAPSSDLGSSIRRAIASSNLGPMGEIQADMAAAQTARNLGLAEKARAEVEAMQRSEADRRNPQLATEYAGNVAGMDVPTATRLSNHLRGVLEQPAAADVDDAMSIGKEAQPFVTGAPNVSDGQRRGFQTALASLIANRLATGHTNAEQLARAGGDLNKTALQNEASDATTVPDANRLVAAMAGKVREPFKTNAQGTVLNEETGDLNEATSLAGAVRTHVAAQSAQASAAAARDAAHAGLYRAQTGAPGGGEPGTPTATLPGGTGTKLMQDADSNARFAVNEKTGRAWKATDNGWDPVLVTNLPKNLTKFGAGGATQSGREAIFTQRVITSANQAAKDLHNVVQLPITASTGVFGGRKQGPGLFDATKEVLANKMTSEEAQEYNAMSAGFQRSLASIESAGLMPSGQLVHQMDAVQFKEGDTNLTKLHKLAQTRQIVESGMEVVLENPRVSESEKAKARQILQSVQKAVPFTHEDLIALKKQQVINSDATLGEVMKARGAAPAAAELKPTNDKGWALMKDASGNQAYVSPDGKQFEEVK